ncbi:MAG: 3-phosphoshikimate 1-carboxyvinyltransferase [Eubacteriales bacterium]
MQSILVNPGNLEGLVRVPLSKSLLHRALICASLAGDLSLADLGGESLSDDIFATKGCVHSVIAARLDQQHGITLSGNDPVFFDCRESGSTLRFLVPLVAALGIPARIVGSGRLPLRPLGEYTGIFDGKGVRMEFPGPDRILPLKVTGQLNPGIFKVPGNISSQYISGLLMALPLLAGDSEIELTTPLESEPYVEMTRDVMRAFGVEADKLPRGYHISGGQAYKRTEPYHAEPDFSQAAFWLVAEYLGHKVTVTDLPLHSSQGDREILTLLEKLKKAASTYAAVEIDVSQFPDLVPILAVAAAATGCVTKITNAGRLRLKECDRLKATCDMMTGLGAEIAQTRDGLVISGRSFFPGIPLFKACEVDSFHDHRMVMAAAIAATRADGPVSISDYRAVDKSYPDFFRNFRMAGGLAHELDVGE